MEEYESVMIQGNQCLEVSFFQSYSFVCRIVSLLRSRCVSLSGKFVGICNTIYILVTFEFCSHSAFAS